MNHGFTLSNACKLTAALIAKVTMKGALLISISAVAHSSSRATQISDKDWLWFYERMGTNYVAPGEIAYDKLKSLDFNFLGDRIDTSIDSGIMNTPAGAHWQMVMISNIGRRYQPQSFAWADQVFGAQYKTKEVQTRYGPMMFYDPPQDLLEQVRNGRNVTNITTSMNTRTRSDGVREMYNGDLRVDTTDGAANSQITRGLQRAIPGISGISMFGGSGVRAKPVQSRGMTKLMGPAYHPKGLGAYGIQKLGQPKVTKKAKKSQPSKETKKSGPGWDSKPVHEPVYGWENFACQITKAPPKALIHFYDENDVKYICKPKMIIGRKDGSIRLVEIKDSVKMRLPNDKRARAKRLGYPGRGENSHISKKTHQLIHKGDYYVIRKLGTNCAAAEFPPKSIKTDTDTSTGMDDSPQIMAEPAVAKPEKPVTLELEPSKKGPVQPGQIPEDPVQVLQPNSVDTSDEHEQFGNEI